MAVRQRGVIFLIFFRKRLVPRKGGGVPSEKGGVPNLEEIMGWGTKYDQFFLILIYTFKNDRLPSCFLSKT